MAVELMFDPFVLMKEFNQSDAKFDPYKLPLMSSYWPSVSIVLFYLLVLRISPRFMKHRQPFQLTKFLVFYNIFQVLSCVYFLVEIFRTGFQWDYLWKCYRPGHENLAQVKLLYFYYFLKIIELVETFCFILRKKFNQMSFLHVYHHGSTLMFSYFGVTLVGSGMLLTLYTLNMIVHSVMYSYYLASIFVRDLDKIVSVKKSITIMQMVQFSLLMVNATRAYWTDCGMHPVVYAFFMPNVAVIFWQFYSFYQKAYRSKGGKAKAKHGKWKQAKAS